MFQIERTVGSSHLNQQGTLSFSAIVDFMQDCCGFQLDNEKELTAYFKQKNVTMFLISRQINIHRPARYGDKLIIRTSIYQFRPAHGYRNTLIYHEDGTLLVSSYAGGAFIHIPEGKAVAVPKELMKTVPMDPKFEGMTYLPRKISLPKEISGMVCEPMKIYRHYLDINQHVNNARYFDLAQECLPEQVPSDRLTTARIEYKVPAKAGDSILPILYTPEPGIFLVSLQDPAGRIFANVEFQEKP